jgi:lysophospholipid acyltransferase (LPLAT)-like uncharacterized protein
VAVKSSVNRLLKQPVFQVALAWVLGLYLRLALRTTRWRFEGLEHVLRHLNGDPTIVAFWHERLPLMPMLWLEVRRAGRVTRKPRVHVLVSRHRDGRLIGGVMRHFHMDLVYGSTRKGGAASLRALTSLLGEGDLIAITPDGPRGPRRQAAPGVTQLAALAGTSILPCAAQISRRRELPSWDRMVLPLPFGHGAVVCGPVIDVRRGAWRETLPRVAAALDQAAERADRLCAA